MRKPSDSERINMEAKGRKSLSYHGLSHCLNFCFGGCWLLGAFWVLTFKLLEIIKAHLVSPQHCCSGLGTQFTCRGQPHSGRGEQKVQAETGL